MEESNKETKEEKFFFCVPNEITTISAKMREPSTA